MILCFQGTPGSGKSFDVVSKILDNLKKGRIVYTNVEGFEDADCRMYQQNILGMDDYEFSQKCHFLDNSQVSDFWNHCKPGSLIVIDEIQNYFGNREWNSEANKGLCRWASTHRHHGYDLIMVTQHIERVDKAVVALVQWTYHYIKTDYFGSLVSNAYTVKVFNGDNVNGKPFSKHHKTYDKKIFNCYKSYVSADVKEQQILKKVNILKHPVFYLLPLLLCVSLYLIFFKSSLGTGDLFGAKKMQKKPAVSSPVQKPVVIEYKDLPVKSAGAPVPGQLEIKSPGQKIVPVSSGLNEHVPICHTEAKVITEDAVIETEICGDKKYKKINGSRVSESSSVRGGARAPLGPEHLPERAEVVIK